MLSNHYDRTLLMALNLHFFRPMRSIIFAFLVWAAVLVAYSPVLYAAHLGGGRIGSSDTSTGNFTGTEQLDNPNMRGFDPIVVTGPNDPFPDTSRPGGLQGSTEFGNGLSAGNTRNTINQNCDKPSQTSPDDFIVDFPSLSSAPCSLQATGTVFHSGQLFQSSRNGLLSQRSTKTTGCDHLGTTADDRRCNEIQFGFLQNVPGQEQSIDMDFIIASLTDADGNLIDEAQGTYTLSITEGGATTACSGTFTFDETNGFVLTSGTAQGC